MDKDRKIYTPLDYGIAIFLAGIAILVYNATLTPSLSYLSPDGNELATVPYVLGLAHSPGYPFYTWLGKIFSWLPIGDVAHRMNLMSAVLGGLGVGFLYLVIIALLHPKAGSPFIRRICAAVATTLFAFSSTFWSQAGIAEVYVPNIAMIGLTLVILLLWDRTRSDWSFFLFSLTFGLSLGTHLSNLGFAPAFIIFILLTDIKCLKRPTWWLAAIAGFGIGVTQFLWLPLKASTLTDRAMLARSPVNLKGIYSYTLGAFSQLKFAFPVTELPDRLVIYLDLLRQEFTIIGLILGVIGLIALLLRRPRHYYLLVGMYLVHVWFFIQYRVFDLEVFFLPSHFLWAIFIAFGLTEAFTGLISITKFLPARFIEKIAQGFLSILLILFAVFPLFRNWSLNDCSEDVSINDFYANLWEILPEDSLLITQGGVFGYDAFYWQLVYDTRRDVELPTLPEGNPSKPDYKNRDIFSTTSVGAQARQQGLQFLPPDLVPQGLWQTPILMGNQSVGGFGGRERLILYQLSMNPPDLVIQTASPDIRLDADLDGILLVGADLTTQPVESGSMIHLVLYWKLNSPGGYQLTTKIGEAQLESHQLGLGNLERYQREVGSIRGQTIVEDYFIVIPSTIPEGDYPLTVSILNSEKGIQVGDISVVDEEETMERWLRIAGK